MEPLIRARLTRETVEHGHNIVSDAAFLTVKRLQERSPNGENYDGRFYDLVVSATMLAFSLDGYVNFVGERKVADWDDRKSVIDKLKAIRRQFGMIVDWNTRPFSSVPKLMAARHMLAHPKTHAAEVPEEIVVGRFSELRRQLRDTKSAFERTITMPLVLEWNTDVDQIWDLIREAAGIPIEETWSGGSEGIEFIEGVEEP